MFSAGSALRLFYSEAKEPSDHRHPVRVSSLVSCTQMLLQTSLWFNIFWVFLQFYFDEYYSEIVSQFINQDALFMPNHVADLLPINLICTTCFSSCFFFAPPASPALLLPSWMFWGMLLPSTSNCLRLNIWYVFCVLLWINMGLNDCVCTGFAQAFCQEVTFPHTYICFYLNNLKKTWKNKQNTKYSSKQDVKNI